MSEKAISIADVLAMPLAEFEERFGFRPTDALEKHWFACSGERITQQSRAAIKAGVLGDTPDLSHVVME